MGSVFILCKVEGYRNIMKRSWRPLAFTSHKALINTKKGLESVGDYGEISLVHPI